MYLPTQPPLDFLSLQANQVFHYSHWLTPGEWRDWMLTVRGCLTTKFEQVGQRFAWTAFEEVNAGSWHNTHHPSHPWTICWVGRNRAPFTSMTMLFCVFLEDFLSWCIPVGLEVVSKNGLSCYMKQLFSAAPGWGQSILWELGKPASWCAYPWVQARVWLQCCHDFLKVLVPS